MSWLRQARFEISGRKDAGAGILARSRRAGNPVRQYFHERRRSSRGSLLPLPTHRSSPGRVRLPGRLPRGPCRVRPAKALPHPRPRGPLRVSPQGFETFPRGGPSPARRRLARPAIPRGAGADTRREAVLHNRGGAGLGGDGGEPDRGASAILRPVQAGGPGTGGGVEAPDGGADEDGGDPGGKGSAGGPGRGGEADGSGNSPRRTGHAPNGGGAAHCRAYAGRADDRHVEPVPRDGVEGVPGTSEEGEGWGVAPESRRARRGDPHRCAEVAHRAAVEAEGLRACQGEARGREEGRGEVPVEARGRWGLRIDREAGDRPRSATGEGRLVHGRELQDPL